MVNLSSKFSTSLWEEAYNALNHEEKGKSRLLKLSNILKNELGKPNLKLRSETGYQKLQTLIDSKSKSLAKSKSSKAGLVCDTMLKIQDLVAAGANVGGPYVAIPAAALFLAFSFKQIYDSDKEAMFKLASKIADYTLYHKRSSELINDLPGDDEHLQTLRRKLRIMCVSLYKLVIFSSAQLTICLHGGNAEKFHHLLKSYDWEGQMSELDEQEVRCNRVREEIFAPWNKPTKTEPKKEKPKSPAPAEKNKSKSPGQTEQKKDTKAVPTKEKKDTKAVPTKEKKEAGPAPRNPLHWAVALGVPEQVTHLVQTNAYPINALTPKKWTALHLAAQKGNTKIMKTLLTASDLNLKITNSDGQTALHIAALYNKVGMVKLLLQRDRGLLGRWDTRGRTASTMAAANGHVAVLKVLKENGQDFNDVASKEGFTALHLAAGYGHVDAVKYLLANGARKNVKLKAGKRAGLTAKEVAEQDGKHDIVALL